MRQTRTIIEGVRQDPLCVRTQDIRPFIEPLVKLNSIFQVVTTCGTSDDVIKKILYTDDIISFAAADRILSRLGRPEAFTPLGGIEIYRNPWVANWREKMVNRDCDPEFIDEIPELKKYPKDLKRALTKT